MDNSEICWKRTRDKVEPGRTQSENPCPFGNCFEVALVRLAGALSLFEQFVPIECW